MLDSLHQFRDRVKQLLAFMDDSETINALVGVSIPVGEKNAENSAVWSHLARLRSDTISRRIQTYVSGIILLYGLFEQYVEEVLIAYLEELDTTINNFEDIPGKIRKSHTVLSAQLLINRELDKYRDRCSEADIIQRMNSCMTKGPFQLNALAFIDHKSNFRVEPLNQFFELAGISGISARMKKSTAFEDYKTRKFPNQRVDNLPDKLVFEDLDDLVWRRNVVAHGWPDETLSIEMMKERAEFIRVIGECLYEVLRQSVLSYIVKHKARALSKPLTVHNNSIVCFHIEAGTIKQGSRIIARGAERYFEGKIITMEIDHIQQKVVTAPPTVDVACLVDFKAKQNYQYYIADM